MLRLTRHGVRIKDMQKVVDDARKALLDMTTVAESKETTEKDADKVEQETLAALQTAKTTLESKAPDELQQEILAQAGAHGTGISWMLDRFVTPEESRRSAARDLAVHAHQSTHAHQGQKR